MIKKLISIVALIIICSIALSAPLTLTQVVNSVNLHFPLIRAQQFQIQKEQAKLFASQGSFDPSINSYFISSPTGYYSNGYSNTEFSVPIKNTGDRIFTGYRLGLGTFPVYDQNRWTYDLGEARTGAEIPLLRNNQIDTRRAQIIESEYNINISQEDLQLALLAAKRDATDSYWDWVAEGKKLQIQQQVLSLAMQRQSVLEKSFMKGNIPQVELLDNQRIILERQINVALQKQNFQQSCLMLSLYYRDANGNPIVPNQNQLPLSPFIKLSDYLNINQAGNIAQIISRNPIIKQFADRRRIAYTNLSLAQNSYLPKLNTEFYVAQDFGGGNPPLNRTSVNVELLFQMPVKRQTAIGNIAANFNTIAELNAEQKMIYDQLKVNITNSENQINVDRNIINLITSEIKVAFKLQKAEYIKFQNGDSNLFIVNLREQSTAESQIKLVDAIANYYKSIATYQYFISQ